VDNLSPEQLIWFDRFVIFVHKQVTPVRKVEMWYTLEDDNEHLYIKGTSLRECIETVMHNQLVNLTRG